LPAQPLWRSNSPDVFAEQPEQKNSFGLEFCAYPLLLTLIQDLADSGKHSPFSFLIYYINAPVDKFKTKSRAFFCEARLLTYRKKGSALAVNYRFNNRTVSFIFKKINI
jgi:hypothetical protein